MNKSGLSVIVREECRKALLVSGFVVPLAFIGCHEPDEPVPDPVVNPSAKIEYFSPASGDAPLSLHLKLSGTQGTNPIKDYKLHIDDKVATSSKPIDTTIVFSAGNYSLFGEVFDVKGLNAKTATTPVNVTNPVVYPPSAKIEYFSPTSGDAPLSLHLKLSGTQGTNPIKDYKLHIDDKVATSSKPIDTTIVFSAGNYSLFGEVFDVKGLNAKTATTPINVNQKLATAELSASVNSGDSPLPVHLKLSGSPGASPFKSYKLYITGRDPNGFDFDDKIIVRSYPIDTLMNFYSGVYTISGEIVDVQNSIVKTASKSINVEMVDPVFWRRSDWPHPKGPVDLFTTPGSTPQELDYNALTTQEARNAVLPGKVTSDITGKIYPPLVCNKAVMLFIYNSHNWGKDLYDGGGLVYGGYDGEDNDEIKAHLGTTKYFGTLGIPVYDIDISPTHVMNCVVTGDDVRDPKSYNLIEANWPWLATNVQPGQVYVPMNYNNVTVYHTYIFKNDKNDKNVAAIPVALLKIVDGQLQFVKVNPNIPIFMTRDEAKKYK